MAGRSRTTAPAISETPELPDGRLNDATAAEVVHIAAPSGPVFAHSTARFHASELLAGNAALVADALEAHGVPYFYLRNRAGRRRIVVVAETDRESARQALLATLSGTATYIAGSSGDPQLLCGETFTDAARLQVFRYAATSADVFLGGPDLACELQFWRVADAWSDKHAAGEVVPPGSLLGFRSKEPVPDIVHPDQAILTEREVDGVPRPTLATQDRPPIFGDYPAVDVVYTWVDGRDPKWQAARDVALTRVGAAELHPTATNSSRFISQAELKYSLRSLDMYADWVRHIYVVTADQVPEWLDVDHERITLISHRKLFGDRGVLPTFNSHAIETQLHRIDGLAENYLYLNDDVFFARPVTPEAFVLANGLAKFFPSTVKISPGPVRDFDRPYTTAAKCNRDLLLQRFGSVAVHKFRHTPHSLRRSVMYDLDKEFPEDVARTASAQFRSRTDISMSASLGHYFGFLTQRAFPADIGYQYLDISAADTPGRLERLLRRRNADVFCLNDNDYDRQVSDEAAADSTVLALLQQFYPLPSQFERLTR